MFPYKFKEKLIEKEDLKKWTTIKTGGEARYMFFPDEIDDLTDMMEFINKNGIKYYLLGKGSKVLFSDDGFDGVIINSRNLNSINIKDDQIEVLCGLNLQNLIKLAMENSFSGIEGLTGIPGSIGGALKMNAGSYGYEIGNVVEKIVLLKDNQIIEEKYKYEYRKGLNDGIYLKAFINLSKSNKEAIKKKMDEYFKIKKKTQPLNEMSFGSVFKNPTGMSAWKLIKAAGCEKLRIGDAVVSKKHCNFIINLGKATSQNIIELIKTVKDKVYEKFNVILEEEVNIVL